MLWLSICESVNFLVCVFGHFYAISHVSKTWKTIFGSSMTGWYEVGGCCDYVFVIFLICVFVYFLCNFPRVRNMENHLWKFNDWLVGGWWVL